ncbi:MAG TPA: DUF402 domain-containing protein [Dehalococcoidia bacterium]|nr:DUF402 domain-containing protein [Dehalococcoidia bacterium]
MLATDTMQIRENKHRLNGHRQTFFCDLLYRDGEAMILRFQTTADPYATVAHTTEGYFWQDRNYLVYKMFNQFGELVGHRFDVCRDVRFGPDSVDWTDLILDFFVNPNGELRVLDETEVEEAVQNGGLSPADQDIISSTRTFMEREYDAVIQEILALHERAGLSSPGSRA